MNMTSRVEQYLEMRRSLGFSLRGEGRMLMQFAEHLDRTGQATVTTPVAVAWASQSEGAVAHRARRLGVVRGFARYLAAFDPACQVPPPGLLPARAHRPTPYHYSAEEIAALVHAAGTLAAPLPAATTQALIRLIATSGLRIGEALALDRSDLDGYAARRDRLRPHPVSPGFFLTSSGRRVQQHSVQQTFARLVVAAGIRTPPRRRRPRIHDLRHTFAVNVLVGWYRDGLDVPARLPVLSAFLGHSGPQATYWYLQATPELLALAAQRLDAHPSGDRHVQREATTP